MRQVHANRYSVAGSIVMYGLLTYITFNVYWEQHNHVSPHHRSLDMATGNKRRGHLQSRQCSVALPLSLTSCVCALVRGAIVLKHDLWNTIVTISWGYPDGLMLCTRSIISLAAKRIIHCEKAKDL